MTHRTLASFTLCALISLTACQQPSAPQASPAPQTFATATSVATRTVLTAPPTATSMVAWQALRDGIDYLQRRERVGETDDWVTVVRIDTSKLVIKVHYDPINPHSVRAWFATLNPDVVINAGFFTEENKATGLVISDGKPAGQTYKGFGGMFSVRDGKAQLQWLARTPYTSDARVTQAVQSFPMLLLNGKAVDGIPDDGSRNRRSFIGIDRAGKVLVGICQSPVWTMSDLVDYLERSPLLDINNALNLDGGASSGLWIKGVPDALQMDSLVDVPTVIEVTAR